MTESMEGQQTDQGADQRADQGAGHRTGCPEPLPETQTGLSVELRQQSPIPLDAAFNCRAGELVALFGPSGSGKSTILRCIAGLHRPRGGRISVDGSPWLDADKGINLPARRRSIGLVSQHYALFPHMTALQNVVAGLSHLPRDQRRHSALQLLEMVHMAELGERRPQQLSGGQQQRVAVARALAREPRVLLLDEPFSAVDKVTRSKLYRELADLRARLNIPVLMVTHDLDEAAALADRMVIVHRGRSLQQGSPFEIMERPADALVARLVDTRNVFPATVVSRGDAAGSDAVTTRLDWGGRSLHAPVPSQNPEQYVAGAAVTISFPPSRVLLRRPQRPGEAERDNTFAAELLQVITLTETTRVVLRLDGGDDLRLHLSLSPHAARRNQLAAGLRVRITLPPDCIHLMPA